MRLCQGNNYLNITQAKDAIYQSNQMFNPEKNVS